MTGKDVYEELDRGNADVRAAIMEWVCSLVKEASVCTTIECPKCGKEFEI